MYDTTVDTEALDAFAKQSSGRSDRFDQARQQMQDGRVGRHSFGYMPAAWTLHDRYTEIVEACVTGLGDGAGAMDDISEGVTMLRETYTAAEQANVDLFQYTAE
jgi:hypothetical protein